MHLLHRSSKRRLAGLAWLALHPLQDRPSLGRDPASIKRLLSSFENQFHCQLPFSRDIREALCHERNCTQEPLADSAPEIAGEESFLSLVSQADHSAFLHASDSRSAFQSDFALANGELDRDPKDLGSCEGAFLDLSVAKSGTTSPRTYKLKKQHDRELYGHRRSGSRFLGIYSCKVLLRIVKRDFHALPEEISVIDSRMSVANLNERRQINADGEYEIDAKEMPQTNTSDRIEKQALQPASDNTENLEFGLQLEDKEAVISHFASKLFLNSDTTLVDEKEKEEKLNDVFSVHHGDIALKFSASSSKKRGCTPQTFERGYFTVLTKKNKKKRKKKNKKSWNAERQLKLKNLGSASSLNQIAAGGTYSCEGKPSMHGKANLPNHNLIMSNIITPVIHPDSSERMDLVDTGMLELVKEGKSNSLGQEVRKQVNCVQQLEMEDASQDSALEKELISNKHTEMSKGLFSEKGYSKLKEVFIDVGVNGEAFRLQEPPREEPNVHVSSHSFEMMEKGKGICNKDDTPFCYQNRGDLIGYDDSKASTSSDFHSKGWLTAHVETSEKGLDGDRSHHEGASKAYHPLGNVSENHLYVILDLNGVLIKRWNANPLLPGVSKLNRRWIQLRPGCIEFLCKAFSKFKVGIWSTMTHKNVMGVCKLLEQQAHQPLPFFMLWSKESCYQQRGVQRPDKAHVLADFKPLSHVWRFFEPYLGFHNTVLIDDSPYKACMNDPYNCIFPDAYEGGTDDNYLTDVLWPYLEKMRMSQNIQAFLASNPHGQQPIVVGHKLYYHVEQVIYNFDSPHSHPRGTAELSGVVQS